MRAKIIEGGLEVELVGSPSEIAAVLREVLGAGASRALPPAGDRGSDAEVLQDRAEDGADSNRVLPADDEIVGNTERIGALQFFQDRKPTNNREATAVAAFYVAEKAPSRDRSATITKELLGDVFRQAQWKLPKRLDQTLVDTMSAGYLNRVDTGVYEISNTGHNLVVHTLGERE